MPFLEVLVNIILILSSLVMIVTVLLQSGQAQGLGAIAGGAETFFGKNKARSVEGKLALITKIAAGIFVAMSLLTLIIS
jgi:preprotein translocase subunit SecG